jgi:hypothetical protein
VKGALLPALALALSALAGISSCLTTAPAEPPPVPPLGPTIIQDAVYPPNNTYLPALPPQPFVVPVRVFDPNREIECEVYVDFDPGSDNSQFATGAIPGACPTMLPALDGGPTLMQFSLTSTNLGDPTTCHVIQCFVADSFDTMSPHTPGDTLGADSVTWQYAPNGPGGCEQFDGGDGAAPPDAPMDALPQTPDAVGSPP